MVTIESSWISTPIFSSCALRLRAELRAHRRHQRARSLDQDHPALAGLDGAKRARQRALGELGDLARQLDAGRPAAHHDEGQPALPFGVIGAHLRGLERSENPPAELQRVVDGLHAGRERREMVVAEVGLLRARGDDQAVEVQDRGHRHQLGGDRLGVDVDRLDLSEEHLDVLLLTQHEPGRRRDLAFGEDARRHLVQQRLEEVTGRLGDQRDVDVGALERLGRLEAAEPGSDDDDVVSPFGLNGSVIAFLPASMARQR